MPLTFIPELAVDLEIELFVVMQIRSEYGYVVVKRKKLIHRNEMA